MGGYTKVGNRIAFKPQQRKAIKRIVKATVASEVDIQEKYQDHVMTAYSAADISPLTLTGFEGKSVNLKKLRVHGTLVQHKSNANSRVIIFQWKSGEQSDPPVPSDILEDPTNVLSFYNRESQPKYKILWDREFTNFMVPGNAATAAFASKLFQADLSRKLLKKLKYDGTDYFNSIHIMTLGNATANDQCQIRSELLYTDLGH